MATESASQIELPIRPPEECTILVVDDDVFIVEALSAVLKRDGYQIITAGTGYDALNRVRDSAPDVVVLDVRLPGMDGIAVCQQIKEADATRFLPVILVTAGDAHEGRVQGFFAGADEFLNKPLDHFELRIRVRSLLRTKQFYDELVAHRQDLEERVAQRTHELSEANKRLEELSQVKGRVIDIVSHELRTPAMQAKLAFNEVVKTADGSPERERMVAKTERAFHRLEYRLNEIRLFSDPTDLKLNYASAADIVHGAVNRVRGLQAERNPDLRVWVEPNLPPVFVDSTKLTWALTHLVDNGVKFGKGSAVQVVAELAEDTGDVVISVTDQGPGITGELLARLFEPLEQGTFNTSNRSHDGFGMGLALTRMVLDAHRVALNVDTELGQGSTFSFCLPRAKL